MLWAVYMKRFFSPLLEYCGPLLLGVGNTQANKLEDTNYDILRSILGFGRQTPYEFFLKTVGLSSLEQRRQISGLSHLSPVPWRQVDA